MLGEGLPARFSGFNIGLWFIANESLADGDVARLFKFVQVSAQVAVGQPQCIFEVAEHKLRLRRQGGQYGHETQAYRLVNNIVKRGHDYFCLR